MNKTNIWLIGAVLVVIMTLFLGKCRKKPISPIITTHNSTTIIRFPDSSLIREKDFIIIQSQAEIRSLRDSLDATTEKLTSLVPELLIKYRDTFNIQHQALLQGNEVLQKQADSIAALLSKTQQLNAQLLAVPKEFETLSKFYKTKGRITRDSVLFDAMELYNGVNIVIGKKGKWFENKTYSVSILSTNPYLKGSSVEAYQFKPKDKKVGILVGPTLMFDPKSARFIPGVGITAGYRIF